MAEDLPTAADRLLASLDRTLAAVTPHAPFRPQAAGPAGTPAAHTLRVLRWLEVLLAQSPEPARAVVGELVALAPRLAWRQTYRRDEAGAAFLENYGWTELVGADGLFREPGVSAGFLILGPHTHYPPHHHPALEHYVPLSGAADWFDATRGWRREPPLTLIVHPPNISHAMRTGEEPLLAYFHWSGDGVDQTARLD